jgi:hypothetical protein
MGCVAMAANLIDLLLAPILCPGIGMSKLIPVELTPGNIIFKLSAALAAFGAPPPSQSYMFKIQQSQIVTRE